MGPNNLPVPYRIYYGQGATSGRVNCIAYDPVVSGTWYVGSAGGGVWKTTNSGTTWTALSDGWPALEVGCIAIDPTNNQRIFVGTGDFNGFGGYGFGIMRSVDGGASWTNIGTESMGYLSVSAILIDPENPNIITASTGRGANYWGYVVRSTDGGNTWSNVITTWAAWNDLKLGARDASGARDYYAAGAGGSSSVEIWRSSDRGATWTKLTTPATSAPYMMEVATSVIAPSTVYLISPENERIWRSDTRGDTGTWVDITGSIPGGYNWSQGWYDLNLTTSTQTLQGVTYDVLYAGLITLAQLRDPAFSWQDIGVTYTWGALTHNDQHSMAIDPTDPNKALVGNDGGVYGLTYVPASNTWSFNTSLNSVLGITQFYHTAPHPTNPDIVIGGTQDNATPASVGDLNNWTNQGGGDGGGVAIDTQNPSNQYASSQFFGGIYRTPDYWVTTYGDSTIYDSGDRLPFIGQMAVDPNYSHLLYVGTNYLWRYNRLTNSWAGRLGGQELSATNMVRSIAVAPTDNNRIYTGSGDGKLWMTKDGGANWTRIDTGVVSLPNRAITSIAVDPLNPNRIVVGLSGTGTGHVWRCNNTGAGASRTWQDRSSPANEALPNIPVNEVALDLDDPINIYYVATDIGVFATEDAGSSWQNATQPLGLPNVQVNSLEAVEGTRLLVAGTYGRGVWRIGLPPKGVFSGFTLSNTTVEGGVSTTGTVTLLNPAPGGGLTVTLKSSSTSAATVPASIVIPAGRTTGTFTVNTTATNFSAKVHFWATSGSWYKRAVLDITPTTIVPVTVTAVPSKVTGGAPSAGKVTLNLAPAADTVIALASSNPAAASVPTNVTVLSGRSFATFSITTYPVVSQTTATISATHNAVTKSVVMTIRAPALASISLSPADVTGGGNSKGSATLTGKVAVGAGPFVVTLSSNNAAASVPVSISIGEGSSGDQFTITTTPVAANIIANITGTAGVITKSANLTIKPPTVKSLSLSPASVIGGNSSTATVTLTSSAPTGGILVALSSSSAAAKVPDNVVVSAGSKTATFVVTTYPVGALTKPVISATFGQTKTATLAVTP